MPSPPAWFIEQLAQRLRRHLGLNLFNFDLIVPMHQVRLLRQARGSAALLSAAPAGASANGASDSAAAEAGTAERESFGGDGKEKMYYLIDINYFPGYEKLPDYETHMVAFLSSLRSRASAGPAAATNGTS